MNNTNLRRKYCRPIKGGLASSLLHLQGGLQAMGDDVKSDTNDDRK